MAEVASIFIEYYVKYYEQTNRCYLTQKGNEVERAKDKTKTKHTHRESGRRRAHTKERSVKNQIAPFAK